MWLQRNVYGSGKVLKEVMKHAKALDPLYIIFEKHVYEFSSNDVENFIELVVSEYVGYLDSQNVIIPDRRRVPLMKDLADEVYNMYMKKIHGCLNLRDYRHSGRVTKLEKVLARDRYYKLTGS